MSGAEHKIRTILASADIEINGSHPWDPQVRDPRTLMRIMSGGTVAIGETYMDGWWDVADLSGMVLRGGRAHIWKQFTTIGFLFDALWARVVNLQSHKRAFVVGEKHYDAGNDLYGAMLDSRMTYTCGYWKNAANLEEAQEAKLDLVCKKIGLKAGDRVLDIGGGWGSFAKFAAEKYGASVVAITVSKEQAQLGRERVAGLPVEIRVQDYRDVTDGPYDHIVSIGMFEHVGYKNYRTYMQKAATLLKDDGFFLLHTIGNNTSLTFGDPWMDKYIFPNGMLPSITQIGESLEGLFVMEDWHNFGADYDKTLMAWFENFDRAWPSLKDQYNERFYRMWKYYLLTCAGMFRARNIQLWQVVLSKNGVPGGYTSTR